MGLAAGGGRRRRGRARDGDRRQRAVRGRLFPGARAARGADPLSCVSEPPARARRQQARVVPSGPAARRPLPLWRRAARARPAPDRGQLRAPAPSHGRVLPPPLDAGSRARLAASRRPADRGSLRVRRRRPAGRAGRLLDGHLHAQSLSRGPHRARLRPARARLAGPAGDELSAGVSAARRALSRCLLRPGDGGRRRHELLRRPALCLPDRRARPHALYRARPWVLDLVVRLRRPRRLWTLHGAGADHCRAARAGSQARAPLRRIAPAT